jgi:hypothetical protein
MTAGERPGTAAGERWGTEFYPTPSTLEDDPGQRIPVAEVGRRDHARLRAAGPTARAAPRGVTNGVMLYVSRADPIGAAGHRGAQYLAGLRPIP